MGTQIEEFNAIQFEKTLSTLKDSQDTINACCKWCLENRGQHKKIVTSWLNVLKRVKIEQRLILFYLANDVIQYSKRKHYDFVESWGTALQKATTLVRDDKVKHKIVRIFNIWQQRGVYNEEFISDLCGLISVVPTAAKNDEPHEFQSSYVINKIKQCSKLESETDLKLKVLKEHNPKIQIETESLCTSLKDRAHVDDVEKELETYVKHLEGYINALKSEIKCRISNISVLKQANTHLDKDKKDVKLVANAYKVFGNKVRQFQKKLEEHKINMASPVPSPDINAPSPSPDCDIELPDDNENKTKIDYNASLSFTAGYYNPVPAPTEPAPSFVTNGYTSFIGSNFTMDGLNTSSLFNNSQTSTTTPNEPPPPPVETPSDPSSFPYQGSGGHLPLLPPPMPPFSAKSDYDNYNPSYSNEKSGYALPYNVLAEPNYAYDGSFNNSSMNTDYSFSAVDGGGSGGGAGAASYPTGSDEYNPEQELDTWETDASWSQPPLDTDTPESPPIFEKEGYVEGVEYHDNVAASGAADVDHRVLLSTEQIEKVRGRGKDVDHRNLISLTGSPGDSNTSQQHDSWNVDQDYRTPSDQDYRVAPPPINLEQLKLPPPPPPPPKSLLSTGTFKKSLSPRKQLQDNVESIDMDLSEEDETELKSVAMKQQLKPPPPLPELLDDVDANSFLDDLDNDLNSNEFTANLHDLDQQNSAAPARFNSMGPPPPPLLHQQQQQQHFSGISLQQQQQQQPPPPTHLQNMQLLTPPPVLWRGGGGKAYGFRGGNNNNNNDNNIGRNNGGFRNQRGRGRGGGFRGGNNFRSRGFNRGGLMRPHKARGNNRGNYQGGY